MKILKPLKSEFQDTKLEIYKRDFRSVYAWRMVSWMERTGHLCLSCLICFQFLFAVLQPTLRAEKGRKERGNGAKNGNYNKVAVRHLTRRRVCL